MGRSTQRTALTVALLLAALAATARAAAGQPPVGEGGKAATVTLRAKWEGTPLLHEAAEFMVGGG